MERQAMISPEQNEALQQKPAFTKAQLWLLSGVLAVGVLWRIVLENEQSWWLGIFWLSAMAVFCLINTRNLAHNAKAIALGVPSVALCVIYMLGYLEAELAVWTFLAIPTCMVTFAVLTTQDVPLRREGAAVRGVLRGVFIKAFTGIPTFFRAIGSLFCGEKRSAARRTFLGLAIGLPLMVVVLALLASADAKMSELIGGLFEHFSVWRWFSRIVWVVAAAMLFYSFFYNMTWGRRDPLPKAVPADWKLAAPAVVIGLLLASYALFIYVQFTYLFGGTLPVDLTYSEYAREGFWQLIAVALINFTVLGVCFVKSEPSRGIRLLETLLIAASLAVLTSAAWRMLLYVGAYGLTIRRVLTLWFMVYLAYLAVAGIVRVYRERTPLMRISSYVLVYWYLAFVCVDWSALMQAYNLVRGFAG
ncbi:MAG TPA: DUF4173 domain-containing protein [Eubacteriales bacterium]|nr:DUF4173 domain-containing protein [Eubacteriales bacterium]